MHSWLEVCPRSTSRGINTPGHGSPPPSRPRNAAPGARSSSGPSNSSRNPPPSICRRSPISKNVFVPRTKPRGDACARTRGRGRGVHLREWRRRWRTPQIQPRRSVGSESLGKRRRRGRRGRRPLIPKLTLAMRRISGTSASRPMAITCTPWQCGRTSWITRAASSRPARGLRPPWPPAPSRRACPPERPRRVDWHSATRRSFRT